MTVNIGQKSVRAETLPFGSGAVASGNTWYDGIFRHSSRVSRGVERMGGAKGGDSLLQSVLLLFVLPPPGCWAQESSIAVGHGGTRAVPADTMRLDNSGLARTPRG